MWFFTGSTIKTVDDHCGYALPFDPLQQITSNNAGYHDIHHQSWGIKVVNYLGHRGFDLDTNFGADELLSTLLHLLGSVDGYGMDRRRCDCPV